MASNGPSKRGIYMTAKVLSIGWKQIFAMARDETKRFSSARLGAAPWTMIGRSCLKLRNWRPPFAGHRNLRLNHHSRQAACLATLRAVWPDRVLDWLSEILSERHVQPALAVVLGVRSARQGIPASLALPAFLQSYIANLVTAGVRLIPLGSN